MPTPPAAGPAPEDLERDLPADLAHLTEPDWDPLEYPAHPIAVAALRRAIAAEARVAHLESLLCGIPEVLAGTDLPEDAGGPARHAQRWRDDLEAAMERAASLERAIRAWADAQDRGEGEATAGAALRAMVGK